MKIWHWLIEKWWMSYAVLISIMLVISIIIQTLLPPPNYQDAEINYQRFQYLGRLAEYFEPLLIFPATVFLIIILLYALKSRNFWRVAGLTGITLVIYVFWVAILGPLVGVRFWSHDVPRMVHADSVSGGDHQYNLASYDLGNYPGTVGGYVIYECDLAGIRCLNIHTEPIYPLDYTILVPELRLNESQIEFYLNDELMYTAAD